jgi:hypothetical protein
MRYTRGPDKPLLQLHNTSLWERGLRTEGASQNYHSTHFRPPHLGTRDWLCHPLLTRVTCYNITKWPRPQTEQRCWLFDKVFRCLATPSTSVDLVPIEKRFQGTGATAHWDSVLIASRTSSQFKLRTAPPATTSSPALSAEKNIRALVALSSIFDLAPGSFLRPLFLSSALDL